MERAIPPSPYATVPAIRVTLLPRDTNAHGTIFGGVILSHIDMAGAVIAQPLGCPCLVTVLMREVEFLAPVFVGDIVSFYGEVLKVGRTSITVKVRVEAQRYLAPHETVAVTAAEVVYVNVDENRKPVPIAG